MRCGRISRLLSRYIDKEIEGPGLSAQVEQHLKRCARCQTDLNLLVATKDLWAQKARITAREDFLVRLKEKLPPGAPVVELKWLPQAGELARRLIPVPVVTTALLLVLILLRPNGAGAINDYIFSDLGREEIAVLSGSVDHVDLLE